jgi:DNA-binding transcriptional ArsR family regulator
VDGDADLAAVGTLLAEPARARMLAALGDGRALPASALAAEAGVAPSTASGHLARLVAGGLLAAESRGRRRYFRLRGPEVAEALEALARVAPREPVRSLGQATRIEALRAARTCYDHLAGRLGTGLMDALLARGVVADEHITPTGAEALARLGVDLDSIPGRRPHFRSCLDWSERRPHAAGKLGAALAARALELGWVERLEGTRAVRITRVGGAAFAEHFGVAAGRERQPAPNRSRSTLTARTIRS